MPEIHHQATADLVSMMDVLLEHGGWMKTGTVAERAGLGRDTARRMLRELGAAGWVEGAELDGEERWRIGPVLPRLGLAYLDLLRQKQEQLRASYDAATIPHTWQAGPHGQAFRPVKP